MIASAITAGVSRVATGQLCLHAVAITPAGLMELRSLVLFHQRRPAHNSRGEGSCVNRFEACEVEVPKKGTSAGKSRAEGIRLFTLAGRPSKEDFMKVYGAAGPKMTWEQRAGAGVPAEKFQAALASAVRQAK